VSETADGTLYGALSGRAVADLASRPHSAGANPERVLGQLRQKLRMNAAFVTMPMGAEADFAGCVEEICSTKRA